MSIDNNTMSFSGAVDHQNMTFSQLFDKWHADRSKSVSERTSKIYRSYIDKYLPDSFKEEAVNRIYHDEWSKIKDEMLAGKAPNGVDVPRTTAMHAISVYHAVFIYGRRTFGLNNSVEDEQISSDTMYSVTVFTPDEIRKMIESVKPFDIYHLGIMLCLYTGVEVGEICAVRWGDIDTENKLLKIRRVIDRIDRHKSIQKENLKVIEPKNKKVIRDLPIPTWINEQLEIMKPMHADEEIFLSGEDGKPSPMAFRLQYARFLKRAGVEKRVINALRHTFAMTCVNDGVDVKTLRDMLGHSHTATTIRMYYGIRKKDKREIVENLYG